jgi:3-methyladenine DNA glycosylase AlkD
LHGITQNLEQNQPLIVKFFASCALEKVCYHNEVAQQMAKPHLGTIINNYLSLLNDYNNSELVDSFENIMIVFYNEIKPWAVDICQYLK